jgi:hypothetical protein
MLRILRRLTRPWCRHEFVERTRRGELVLACVGCGKPLRGVVPARLTRHDLYRGAYTPRGRAI